MTAARSDRRRPDARGRLRRVLAVVALVVLGVGSGALTIASASPAGVRLGRAPRLVGGARATGALADPTPLSVALALAPRDPAALAQLAAAVSTPGSGSFHHFLSVADFRSRFAPRPAAVAALTAALRARGLAPGALSANGLLLRVDATAGTLGRAFSTGFSTTRIAGRSAYFNTAAPELPASVASTVAGVIGLDSLSIPRSRAVRLPARRRPRALPNAWRRARSVSGRVVTGGPQPCAAASADTPAVTADRMASAYDFSGLYGTGDLGAGQTVGLLEMEPYAPTDIAAYQACYGANATVTDVPVDGGAGVGPGAGEAALDIETVIGLAPKASIVTYTGSTTAPGYTGYVDAFNRMVSANVAKVLSTSWYAGPCDPYTDPAVTSAEANALMEAAVQGQSFFNATGDVGSNGCSGTTRPTTTPELGDPSGQPFVTDVGGTTFGTLGPPPTERVWNNSPTGGAGSGGISAVATMPDYQLNAAPSLGIMSSFSSGTPCGAATGHVCREAPDVSADADPNTGYTVLLKGAWTVIGGTSASAPLWAALTALGNAAPACHGVNLGFLNPLLYGVASTGRYAADFHDVTVGNNNYPANTYPNGAYPAAAGYDMATGLGTPDAANLAADLCAAKVAAVAVTNPGNQSTSTGASVNLPIAGSDANSARLSYSATGLPAGLSINPTTGVISGSPSTPGSLSTRVTATDADGAMGSTTFAWQVSAPATSTTTTATSTATTTTATTATSIPPPAPAPSSTTTAAPTPTASAPDPTPSTTPTPGPDPSSTTGATIDCPVTDGPLGSGSLGPIHLGQSGSELLSGFSGAFAARGTGDIVCLSGPTTVFGVPTARQLRRAPADLRRRYAGRVVIALTEASTLRALGYGVGERLRRGARPVPGASVVRAAGDVFYLHADGASVLLLRTHGGAVTGVGVAVRSLILDHKVQRTLLGLVAGP